MSLREQRGAGQMFALLLCAVGTWAVAGSVARGNEKDLVAAHRLLLSGKYGEAEAAFEKIGQTNAKATIGIARCRSEKGDYRAARDLLKAALKRFPESASCRAELAWLEFQRGGYEQATSLAESSLKLDSKNTLARWVRAETFRAAGKLDEAETAYEWFVDFYNDADEGSIRHVEDYVWIGRAAAQFARWKRLHDQFAFLVNQLYPDVLSLEKQFWPAHYLSGLLFLEKYNRADASKSLQAALQLNPNAAAVHAAMARLHLQSYDLAQAKASIDRALQINPNLLSARRLRADWHLSNFEPHKALPVLEKALELKPNSERTLGRIAACYGAIDGIDRNKGDSRMQKLVARVNARNAHAARFHEAIGDALDKLRKFPDAAHHYREAARRMPQRPGVTGKLGMVHMRLGDEAKAKKILEDSFKADSFNVRVKNTLTVLDVLENYETIETEHFLIRFDPRHDRITARFAARYLEEIYPVLCRELGYTPPDKTLFELFSKARNTDAHGWFSARMVGLPHIHTIGACAGKMVAMVSPTGIDQPFHWARVLKHELVHVINLQQTDFNIPHWFTEALAVHYEQLPRSQRWNEMLARRVPAGETFDLASINMGFIRPSSSEDWQMAYCQAELYAQYMLKRFGPDALAKMLKAYHDHLTTPAAIKRSFDVELDEFEKGYQQFVKEIVSSLGPASPKEASLTFSQLQKAVEKKPDDPELVARLAFQTLRRGSGRKARSLAERALELKPKHQLATYVKAKLFLSIGESAQATSMLERCLDESNPQAEALSLLAALRVRAKRFDEALRLYKMGVKSHPSDLKWLKATAAIYLRTGDDKKLAEVLKKLVRLEGDNAAYRKKLAGLAMANKQYTEALHWAVDAIHIDVTDHRMHRVAADALVALEKYGRSVDHFEAAIELDPKNPQHSLACARACLRGNDKAKAREVLQAVLKRHPNHADAERLLEMLEP